MKTCETALKEMILRNIVFEIHTFVSYQKICDPKLYYMITNKMQLSICTSMKHSLLSFKLLALALNSLDTLSDIRIKVFMLLF